MNDFTRRSLLLSAALLPLAEGAAFACATCFGEAGTPIVEGAKAGVLFLAVVIYAILTGGACLVGYWMYRAKKLAKQGLLGPVPGAPVAKTAETA